MAIIIIFLLLILLYAYLGFKFIQDKNIVPFLLVTVTLPLTSAITPLHTRFQISAYYFFVFVPTLVFIFQTLLKQKLSWNITYSALIILCFVLSYLVYDLMLYRENLNPINLLKDLKPLLFLLLGFVFLSILKNHRLDWNGKIAKRIMKYNCIASLLWFVFLNNTNLISFISNDPYYTLSETTRYSAVGTIFVILYYIAGLANNRKFDKFDFLYILIPLFLTGNRTHLFAIGIIYIVYVIISSKNVLLLFRRAAMFLIAILALIFGVFSFNEKLKIRLLTMLDLELVVIQLFEHRFAPFMDKLITYNWYDYIFGKGIGETILIPWFVWREDVDNFNIYMDNIYLTLYIKYGVFSLIIIMLFYYFIRQTNTNRRFCFLIMIYFGIIGITTAFIYQRPFLFMLIALSSFGFVKNKVPVKG